MEEIKKFEALDTLPAILDANKNSLQKAREVQLKLLADIEASGMSTDLDLRCNDYLARAKKQLEIVKTRREPITQLLTSIAKEFTTLEADLKKDIDQIQQFRNDFAKQELERQKAKELEAQKLKELENEKTSIRSAVELAFSSKYNSILTGEIQRLQDRFNSATLENFMDIQEVISKCPVHLSENVKDFTVNAPTLYLSNEIKKSIKTAVIEERIEEFKKAYNQEIEQVKKNLIDQLPSKFKELQEIASADQEKQKELLAAKEKRESEEAERLKTKTKEREDQENLAIKQKEEESKMVNTINAFAAVEPIGKERTGFNIIVSHPAAFMQIFALWFELEGKNLGIDAIEKKTVKQMKTVCEKHAHENESFIKSDFIKYDEIVKVRTTK